MLLTASLPLPPPFDALSSEDLRRARAAEERAALHKTRVRLDRRVVGSSGSVPVGLT